MQAFSRLFFFLLILVVAGVSSSCTTIDYGLGEPRQTINIWVDSFTQAGAYESIDILWVIDRSCSMNDNDMEVVAGVEAMMNSLSPDVNWRLQMITTGLQPQPNTFPLTQGSTSKDALYMLAGLPSDHQEQGFSAVQEYIEYDPYAQTWLRPYAALLVVFVSDEEEQSKMSAADFAAWYQYQRGSVYLSSIVNVEVANSVCQYLHDANVGSKYMDAAKHFNGNIIDICSTDWSAGVEEATQRLEPLEEWPLTHIPSLETIVVFIDGLPDYGWEYEEEMNMIYFDTAPPEAALVEISYAVQEFSTEGDDPTDTATP
jgi:hypothetical protein